MLRILRRAALLFAAYTSLLLAVIVAGALNAAIGTWAAILWGAAVLAAFALYVRQRLQRPGEGQEERPSS